MLEKTAPDTARPQLFVADGPARADCRGSFGIGGSRLIPALHRKTDIERRHWTKPLGRERLPRLVAELRIERSLPVRVAKAMKHRSAIA